MVGNPISFSVDCREVDGRRECDFGWLRRAFVSAQLDDALTRLFNEAYEFHGPLKAETIRP